MIDKSTGIINLVSIKVGAHTNLTELSERIRQGTLKKQKTGENWSRVSGRNTDKFAFSLYFDGLILKFISLSFLIENERKSWDDWTEEHELKRKSFHDAFLLKELGKAPYKYEWGTVSSYYDQKGGSSSIGIRYFQK